MKLFALIRERRHPLHRARRWRWFQMLQHQWDPIIPVRLRFVGKPIYLRLFAHASLQFAGEAAEENIRKTMTRWMASPEGNRGFWDVGANVGFFSFIYASGHPGCPMLSFEPDRRNIECLRRTMSAWNLASDKLICAAVSDHTGSAPFIMDRLSGATGTLQVNRSTFNERHYQVKGRTESVDLVCLDDFYDSEGPGLVRIDVEGGGGGRSQRGQQASQGGFPVLLYESSGHKEECNRLLATYDYSLYDSDRCGHVSDRTTNFLALVLDKASEGLTCALREMGYPL